MTSLSFSYNMSEAILKGNRKYLFLAASQLSSTSSFSIIVKFFDDLIGARPEHLDECSKDYAKNLLIS